mmetsp:Transcript_57129/g.121432  ORF Transcript_57129/g.121432 Transcript_57129/m.121432 type:complete len:234 (+) Transcript_57129:874-1575(+)
MHGIIAMSRQICHSVTPRGAGALLGASREADVVDEEVGVSGRGPVGGTATVEGGQSPIVNEHVVLSRATPANAVQACHLLAIHVEDRFPVGLVSRRIQLDVQCHVVPSAGLEIDLRVDILAARFGPVLVVHVHNQLPLASPHRSKTEAGRVDGLATRGCCAAEEADAQLATFHPLESFVEVQVVGHSRPHQSRTDFLLLLNSWRALVVWFIGDLQDFVASEGCIFHIEVVAIG